MSKAILVSGVVINIIDGLYGFLGYAAFGDSSPRNVLTGFDFHNPYWPVAIIANVLIVVYFVGAYQVSCQPQFQSFEKFAAEKFPDNDFIRKEFEVRIPGCKPFKLNLFKLVSRTLWVILGTFIAKKLPFFNDIIGLIGAISYWPLAVCFPVEMFIVQTEIPKWSKKWICLKMLSATCFVLTVIGAGGSAAVGLVQKYRNPSMNDY
ncbi:hypothetical protein LR48_Vigan07g284700 [Vigna angularis]|uniref:Amino acid permease 3 Amino acid transporter n=1 Tax=Phaseolus angularis TaxID=3914 RepID=A0A0L9V279_PHAAN|nr:Amino acid permease 3 Amino acid transporter [Vigna angularis]KOM49143.1 hypothetical protein LR48_Vigan07g284700 [Vigna angularis]